MAMGPPPSRKMTRTPPVYQQEERRSYQEEAHHGRRDSVLSPSRRVSNQVFPEDGPVYSPSMQGPSYPVGSRWEGDGYEEAPQGRRRSDMREVEELEEQSEYTRRYSSTTSPTGPRRGATPEEDLRRMHVLRRKCTEGAELVTVGHHRQ